MNQKSQAAIEYVMIVAFIFTILTPLIYLVYNYSNEYSKDISVAQTREIAHELVDSSEALYYYGEPSRKIIEVNMPAKISRMSIYTKLDKSKCNKCTELRFLLGDNVTKIVVPSLVTLKSVNDQDETINLASKNINVTHLSNRSFNPGRRSFKLIARQDYVGIKTLEGQ